MRSLRVRLRLTTGVDSSSSESEMLTTERCLCVRFAECEAAAVLPLGDGLRLGIASLTLLW